MVGKVSEDVGSGSCVGVALVWADSSRRLVFVIAMNVMFEMMSTTCADYVKICLGGKRFMRKKDFLFVLNAQEVISLVVAHGMFSLC